MKLCSQHWTELRTAILDRGLWPFVSTTGEAVTRRTALWAEFGRAEDFDPLIIANADIFVAFIGDAVTHRTTLEGCPLCIVEGATSGMALDWINGASDDQLETARALGLFKQDA